MAAQDEIVEAKDAAEELCAADKPVAKDSVVDDALVEATLEVDGDVVVHDVVVDEVDVEDAVVDHVDVDDAVVADAPVKDVAAVVDAAEVSAKDSGVQDVVAQNLDVDVSLEEGDVVEDVLVKGALAHLENVHISDIDGILWEGTGVSNLVVDDVGKRDGRVAAGEVATEVVVNDACR